MPPNGPLRRYVWASRVDVSHFERAVLLVLCDYANRDTVEASCSVDTLAERLRTGARSVRRALDALMLMGLITRVQRHPRAPAVYRLELDSAVWEPKVGWGDLRGHGVPGHEDPGHGVPGHGDHPRGDMASSERGHGVPVEGTWRHPNQEPEPDHEPVSHAGAREDAELPPEQWGKGWGEQKPEEQETPENLVHQSLNGPSQHAFYGSRGEEGHRPSTPAARISESASPVISDVERAVAHYAEVAPLTLRRSLRGPSRARADVEAAVAQHGADAVCAAIDDARWARADGCPPWDWVVQRLEGRAPKVNGISRPRVSGDPRKSEGWSWKP